MGTSPITIGVGHGAGARVIPAALVRRRPPSPQDQLPWARQAEFVICEQAIENRLHWVLDVVFRDDLSRLRTGHAPANMAVVKHMALNLLRQAKPTTSLKNRRKLAGWNLDYLDRLIRGDT